MVLCLEQETAVIASGLNTNLNFNIGGLQVNTAYDYYVRSICSVGDTSVWSVVGTFTTDDIQVLCLEPTNLTATNITTTGADLDWTEVNAALEWEVEYGLGGFVQGTGTVVGTTTKPLSVSGLADDTDYDFYVRSICGVADTSSWSAVGSFRTDTVVIVPCLAPAGLSVSDIGVDSAFLNWTDLNGSSQWEIEYETAGFTLGTGVNQIVNAPSPFEITQLSPGLDYDVYIRSICGVGDTSDWVDTTFRTDTIPVGLREFDLANGLKVYPNPSNGLFTLDIQLPGQERLNLVLRDVRGQLIHTEGVTVNGVYRDNLDFTGLAKGVYYLQVQSERESIIKKLVIQ